MPSSLDSFRLWRLSLAARDAVRTLPFNGWIVRGAMGMSLRGRSCRQDCGDGPCKVGAGCPYTDAFEPPEGRPRFRLDASELDGRDLRPGDRWELRVVTFDPGSAEALVHAVADAAEAGLGEARHRHEVATIGEPEPIDPWRRAAELGPWLIVELATPTAVLRGGRRVRDPQVRDVLHAALHRARALGLDTAPLPRFEPEVRALLLGGDEFRGRRWSARRACWVPVEGSRASWNVEPTPAQGVWLALAEALGVGTGTAFGMGVVRLAPR